MCGDRKKFGLVHSDHVTGRLPPHWLIHEWFESVQLAEQQHWKEQQTKPHAPTICKVSLIPIRFRKRITSGWTFMAKSRHKTSLTFAPLWLRWPRESKPPKNVCQLSNCEATQIRKEVRKEVWSAREGPQQHCPQCSTSTTNPSTASQT